MIIFSHPAVETGGVQRLIINLVQYITENKLEEVGVLDYQDGYVKKYIDDLKLNYYFFDIRNPNQFRQTVSSKDVFVLFGGWRSGLKAIAGSKIKILVWQVFPTTITNLFALKTNYQKNKPNAFASVLTDRLVKLLVENKALCLMSASHAKALTPYIDNADIPLLPIPVKTFNKKPFFKNLNQELNISIVGRGEEVWKVKPVKKLLLDLECVQKNITIHIITTKRNELLRLLSPINIAEYPHKIVIKENLSAIDLDNYLHNNIDINFAMGTALLESGKLGIPSVFLDASYNDLPENYEYRWLFEAKGYALGNALWLFEMLKGYSIKQIIDELSDKTSRRILSKKCYEYVVNNHSLEVVAKKLIAACENTTLLNSHLKKYLLFLNITTALRGFLNFHKKAYRKKALEKIKSKL